MERRGGGTGRPLEPTTEGGRSPRPGNDPARRGVAQATLYAVTRPMSATESATEPRSGPELVSLLLELARVVKARRYFEPGDPRLVSVFGHARRAWAADLMRHGALEVSLEEGVLAQGDENVPIDQRLGSILSDWAKRGVWRLRVEPEADPEAFAALIEVLAMPLTDLEREGGASPALARRVVQSIRVEAPDDAPGLPLPKEPCAKPAPTVEDPNEHTDVLTVRNARDTRSPSPPPPVHGGSDTEPLSDVGRCGSSDDETLPVALRRVEATGEHEGADEATEPSPSDLAAALLREIEGGARGPVYAELVDGLVRLVETESVPLGLAASLRILAALAAECEAKREDEERSIAEAGLRRLAVGERLEALLEQVGERGAAGERALSVLSRLGGEVAGALAERALAEDDPERAERLDACLLALDPAGAAGPVLAALNREDRAVVLRAVELADRLGHSEVISRLGDLLRSPDEFVREASARALARRASPDGGDDALALRSLARGLTGGDPHLAVLCAECLSATGSPRAVPPLATSMHAAIERRDFDTALERIHNLGELGRPEAAAELGRVLLQRNLLGRRRLRELQLAATRALARLPGDEAVGVLSQATQLRDTQLREAAQTALERRQVGGRRERPV